MILSASSRAKLLCCPVHQCRLGRIFDHFIDNFANVLDFTHNDIACLQELRRRTMHPDAGWSAGKYNITRF